MRGVKRLHMRDAIKEGDWGNRCVRAWYSECFNCFFSSWYSCKKKRIFLKFKKRNNSSCNLLWRASTLVNDKSSAMIFGNVVPMPKSGQLSTILAALLKKKDAEAEFSQNILYVIWSQDNKVSCHYISI